MSTNYIETSHEFYFTTDGVVTPTSLAESLLGLDGVLKHSSRVLEKLTGVSLKTLEIELQAVELNSYKDTFLYRMAFGTGRKAEKKVEELRKALGLQNMDTKKLISICILGAILWGAWTFTKSTKPADQAARIQITNSFNQLSGEVGMTPDEFIKVLDDALGKRKEQLRKDVVRLTHPDGNDTNGKIVIDGMQDLAIPDQVLEALPISYEKDEPKEREREFVKRDIIVRAMDMDRPQAGWAAVVPDVSDSRLPVIIGEEISPGLIPIGKLQVADFTVVWKKTTNGEEKPIRIVLHRIHRN